MRRSISTKQKIKEILQSKRNKNKKTIAHYRTFEKMCDFNKCVDQSVQNEKLRKYFGVSVIKNGKTIYRPMAWKLIA